MNFFTGAYWKAPLSAGVAFITFTESEWVLFMALFVWICIDVITGMLASKYEGKKICSSGMFKSSAKLAIYYGGALGMKSIALCYPEADIVLPMYLGWAILTEVKSFFENMTRLGYGKDIKDKILGVLDKTNR